MNFWTSKKVVVTGAYGFVGKHLVKRLTDLGATVVGIHRSEYNLCLAHDVDRLFDELPWTPRVVFHLAAVVGGIGANKLSPADMYHYNVIMDTNVIRKSASNRVGTFVGMGSVCAYPKYAQIPFRESNVWDGYPEETNAAYGTAKRGMLMSLQAHGDQYDLDWRYALSTNLYGPGDNFDVESGHVVAGLIRKFEDARATGIPPSLWGTGNVTRDLLYVDDLVSGLLLLAERGRREAVNFGSGSEISIKHLAMLVKGICDYSGEYVWNTSKPDGQPRRVVDTTRALMTFGWKPQMSLEEGIHHTLLSYREKVYA